MLNKDLLKILGENKFFEKVDETILAQLDKNYFREAKYDAGDLIVKQNSEANGIFLIISGNVMITKDLPDDKEVDLFERYAGDFVGEFSLVGHRKRSANVYAASSCKIIEIEKDDFFTILDQIPQVRDNIARGITEKMCESDDKTAAEIERNYELLRLNQKINAQKKELERLNRELSRKNRELQESEKNLKQANASKDKFFSIIAHDLRNPLSIMIGFSDMLREYFDKMSVPEIKSSIVGINNSAKNLLNLLENLLEWSRSETGRIDFDPMHLELDSIITSNILLLNQTANSKKINITSEVKEGICVYADRNMLTTIFRNLLSNAIKFTPKGGNVIVTSEDADNFVKISVIDTGIGIDEKDIDKLFRIDVHHTTIGTHNEKGTGLGLILCKEFIEKNGGKIWVESEFGEGSTFSFLLPKEPIKIEE